MWRAANPQSPNPRESPADLSTLRRGWTGMERDAKTEKAERNAVRRAIGSAV